VNATRSRVCSVELRFYHERYHNVGYILYCNECWHICTSGLWCSHLIADELSARLVSAIKRDDLDELKMLLELGADPDSRSVEVDEVGCPKVSYWKSTKHDVCLLNRISMFDYYLRVLILLCACSWKCMSIDSRIARDEHLHVCRSIPFHSTAFHRIAAHADSPPCGRQGGQGRRMPDAASGGRLLSR